MRIFVLFLALAAVLQSMGSTWGREPFGAEDHGAERHVPSIPEPMVFDLVRGLGARRGECEVNVLGLFPLGKSDEPAPPGFDPIGLAPGSEDRDGIEWAPEIEYAIADGFAIEFELPFENSKLEAYKFAAQWTFAARWDERFIDGAQVIVEPDVEFEIWDLTFLYLAGMQFDRRWSTLGMVGVRPEIVSGGSNRTDGIANLTVFYDLDYSTTLGLESNITFGDRDRTSLLLIPQIDFEITDHVEFQFGGGAGFSTEAVEPVLGLRLIYSQ